MRRIVLAVPLIAASAAGGQQSEPFLAEIPDCLDKASQSTDESCVYDLRNACEQSRDGGMSTQGMVICDQDATKVWQGLLDQEFLGAQAAMARLDQDMVGKGREAKAVSLLVADQKAWVAYRAATCAFQSARWGNGTFARTAGSTCLLSMTAERAIELRQIWSIEE